MCLVPLLHFNRYKHIDLESPLKAQYNFLWVLKAGESKVNPEKNNLNTATYFTNVKDICVY